MEWGIKCHEMKCQISCMLDYTIFEPVSFLCNGMRCHISWNEVSCMFLGKKKYHVC